MKQKKSERIKQKRVSYLEKLNISNLRYRMAKCVNFVT